MDNLKAAYGLSEFAAMLGESPRKVRALADRGKLPTEKIGNKRYVPLASICEAFPLVWESMIKVAQLRGAAAGSRK